MPKELALRAHRSAMNCADDEADEEIDDGVGSVVVDGCSTAIPKAVVGNPFHRLANEGFDEDDETTAAFAAVVKDVCFLLLLLAAVDAR
jgi:hypothetical protein